MLEGPAWGDGRAAHGLHGGSGDDLRGKVEVCAEELIAVVGEEPVVAHPAERLPHIALRFEDFYHMQVRDIDVGVLGQVVVLHRTTYPSTPPHPLLKKLLGFHYNVLH